MLRQERNRGSYRSRCVRNPAQIAITSARSSNVPTRVRFPVVGSVVRWRAGVVGERLECGGDGVGEFLRAVGEFSAAGSAAAEEFAGVLEGLVRETANG
jgi:hypothetical protein